jgi:hypothetical protein
MRGNAGVFILPFFILFLFNHPIAQEISSSEKVPLIHFSDTGQALGEANSKNATLGDVDTDGDLDVFIANSDTVSQLWLNDGKGYFTAHIIHYSSYLFVGFEDVDSDGDLDAFVSETDGGHTVLLNDGQGRFSDTRQFLGTSGSQGIDLGDLDGDGDCDAFVAHWGFPNGLPNRVWINDGSGRFTDSGQQLGEMVSMDVALRDIDNDGDLDAFVANQCDSTHAPVPDKIWINDGKGLFTDSGQEIGTACSYEVALGDVDGDGDPDAFIANSSHAGKSDPTNRVYLNDGRGRFTDSGQRLGDVYSLDVALGDLDGDGDLDAVVGNYKHGIRVWLNDGTGRFVDSGFQDGDYNAHDVALGDLNGDDALDIVVATNTWQGGSGTNKVYFNQSLGARP